MYNGHDGHRALHGLATFYGEVGHQHRWGRIARPINLSCPVGTRISRPDSKTDGCRDQNQVDSVPDGTQYTLLDQIRHRCGPDSRKGPVGKLLPDERLTYLTLLLPPTDQVIESSVQSSSYDTIPFAS